MGRPRHGQGDNAGQGYLQDPSGNVGSHL
jgi:hypothetical protein